LNNLELLYKIETTLYKIKISLSQKIFSNFSATQTVRKETASFQWRIFLCVLTLQRTQAIVFFSTFFRMELMSYAQQTRTIHPTNQISQQYIRPMQRGKTPASKVKLIWLLLLIGWKKESNFSKSQSAAYN